MTVIEKLSTVDEESFIPQLKIQSNIFLMITDLSKYPLGLQRMVRCLLLLLFYVLNYVIVLVQPVSMKWLAVSCLLSAYNMKKYVATFEVIS